MTKSNIKQEQETLSHIFEICAKLIYEQLADAGWNKKHLGYQEGGI